MNATRTVTWGEGLLVAAHRHPGGLNQAVDRIRRVVGARIGVRNSFSKLYNIEDPTRLSEVDRERAWYLLVALEENPSRWGIYDDDLPPLAAGQVEKLKVSLCAPRDSNPEPTDYGSTRVVPLRPRGRSDRSTGPRGRAA